MKMWNDTNKCSIKRICNEYMFVSRVSTIWKKEVNENNVQAESHILYRQRKGGDLMKYVYYINGVRRDKPTKEEAQILLDRLMEGLGYERINKDEDKGSGKKNVAVV